MINLLRSKIDFKASRSPYENLQSRFSLDDFAFVGFRLAILNLDDLSIEYIGGTSSGMTKL